MAITYPGGERLYEGAVLATRERNYLDDSDFYAVVWDGSAVTDHEYATTRFGGGGHAEVDATDEVRHLAGLWLVEWAATQIREAAWTDALRADIPGREVVVTGGRKHLGRAGVVVRVVRVAPRWSQPVRVQVTSEDGQSFWVPAAYCRVADPWDNVAVTEDEVRAHAEKFRHSPTAPFTMSSRLMGLTVMP